MENACEMSAQRMEELERRVMALEERTRRALWYGCENGVSREDELALQYGEYVDKTVAARILGVTRTTVYAMLSDGRITGACAGRRVDVRSIARYMGCTGAAQSGRGRRKHRSVS